MRQGSGCQPVHRVSQLQTKVGLVEMVPAPPGKVGMGDHWVGHPRFGLSPSFPRAVALGGHLLVHYVCSVPAASYFTVETNKNPEQRHAQMAKIGVKHEATP
ncbi:hypothetical protein ES703_83627 [subsurface metagenome]